MNELTESLLTMSLNVREAKLLTMSNDEYDRLLVDLHAATGPAAEFYRAGGPARAMQIILDPPAGTTSEDLVAEREIVGGLTGISDPERAAQLCQARAHADSVETTREAYQRRPWPLDQWDS